MEKLTNVSGKLVCHLFLLLIKPVSFEKPNWTDDMATYAQQNEKVEAII